VSRDLGPHRRRAPARRLDDVQSPGAPGVPRAADSQTDSTEDLERITVPVLVVHGDDQVVSYADSAPLSAELLQNGTLKTCAGFPHGMPTTQAETINADLLAFVRS
jgi:non-heme chloroperoxidase